MHPLLLEKKVIIMEKDRSITFCLTSLVKEMTATSQCLRAGNLQMSTWLEKNKQTKTDGRKNDKERR